MQSFADTLYFRSNINFTFNVSYFSPHIEKPKPSTTSIPINFDTSTGGKGSKENIVSVINWLLNATKYNRRVRPVDYSDDKLTVKLDLKMRSMIEVLIV